MRKMPRPLSTNRPIPIRKKKYFPAGHVRAGRTSTRRSRHVSCRRSGKASPTFCHRDAIQVPRMLARRRQRMPKGIKPGGMPRTTADPTRLNRKNVATIIAAVLLCSLTPIPPKPNDLETLVEPAREWPRQDTPRNPAAPKHLHLPHDCWARIFCERYCQVLAAGP
jgi:hypothetical protein